MADAPSTPPPSSEKSAQKVELDLDDAPFLEEEEVTQATPEAEAVPPPAVEEVKLEQPEAPKKQSLKDRLLANKKRLIIAGGAAVLLVCVGIGLNMFLFGGDPKPKAPPPPPPPVERRIVVPDKPPPLPEVKGPKNTLSWDEFRIPQKDAEGNVRFLVCKFAVPTDSDMLFGEMQAKKVLLRDAIFYYLRNRQLTILTTKQLETTLKTELMTVINEHVTTSKVEDIYIEQYLVK